MSESSESERRGDLRLPEHCQVSYRTIRDGDASPKQCATETINLSASGLCLRAPDALEPELHLALELTLEGQEDPVMALGRVVWCDRDDAGYRVGVCFTWMREEDREDLQIISDYIESRSES